MEIKKYKLYLIDLDGTMYNGNEEILYAKEFISYLNKNSIDYLFLTNNSTKNKEDVVKKLAKFGIETFTKNIFISSEATAMYLKEKNYNKVYVIGEGGLVDTLLSYGVELDDKESQAVVVGLDTFLTYEKLTIALRLIMQGAEFIGTNPDRLIPTEKGLAPSNGAQVSFLEYALNEKATIIGKPSKIIMQKAIDKFNYAKDEIVMVGDNYDTDIMSGINIDIDTIHVQTGVTSKEELKEKKVQPTYTIENLSKLIEE